MKQLKSKKTGAIHILTDEEYEVLKVKGLSSKYTVTDLQPIKAVIPPLIQVEIKKKVKSNERRREEKLK